MSQRKLSAVAAAAAAVLAFSAGSARAAGTVEVHYMQPDKFTDTGFSNVERERALRMLSDVFEKLGARLPDGQVLRLDVQDVDLAGNVYPNFRAGQDIRVLRGGADWPRIELHYSLVADGKTLKAGDAKLADMNYFMSNIGLLSSQEMAYEKHMVQQWFDKTFAPPK